jgi:hypothetical protein
MVEETSKSIAYKPITFDPQAIKDSELYKIANHLLREPRLQNN